VLREGAEVAIVGRSEKRLQQAVSELKVADRCRSFTCDMADEEQVKELFGSLGLFDHLVITAAGDVVYKPFDALSKLDAHQVLNNKFIGAFILVKYGKPSLRNGGSIVFTAGINA
jgi:NAD(P)-dependent dehydrogenase (short-subunit alcohol dehydrogenase family)